jgi:prolipoprotein diacylglyceryl transferase
VILAAIPSPTTSLIPLGPIKIHAYALCIIAGILVAIWLTDRRWRARGGGEGQVEAIAGWVVVFGIIGGRLYHVITDPELYFKAGRNPLDALKIWDGGLGIWGAVALGALGAWIGCRRHGLNFLAFADSAMPAVLIAQGIGRFGNWFNNELYGRPTDLPWKLKIYQMDSSTGHPLIGSDGQRVVLGFFQPTFLYEAIWNFAIAALLLVADRRIRLAAGQVLALYIVGYTTGRFWIELMRSDTANHILGLRVNTWVSAIVFLGGVALFVRQRGKPRSVANVDSHGDDASERGLDPASDPAGTASPDSAP